MPCYRINQFHVESVLNLPCASSSLPNNLSAEQECLPVRFVPDVLHEFSCVSWIGRRYGGEYLRAYEVGDGVLVCAGNHVRMQIDRQGSGLVLDFAPQDEEAASLADALTINLGMSLCTLFRGDIALHGAGVEVDGKMIGILAPSGTGKSTLLWRLLDNGARFANDDVVPIHIEGTNVQAFPSLSLPAKLSKKAMEARNMDWTQYQETLPGEEEFWIPIPPEQRLLEPRPLAAIFVLQPVRQPERPGQIFVRRHTNGAAVSLLLANTQGMWAAYGLLDAKRLFAQYVALMQSVPVYTIEYARCLEVLPDMVRTLREVIAASPKKEALNDAFALQSANPLTHLNNWVRSRSPRLHVQK